MRYLLFLAAFGAGLAADIDANDLVRRSVERDNDNWKRARYYTFIERVYSRELDGGGKVKKTESWTFDVTMLEGSPYRRLIERDDQPLPPSEERKQQEKLRKSIEQRRKETPAQREKRLADSEKRRARNRDLVREVAAAFDFRMLGEEAVGGRPAYVLEATPRPGYSARDARARIFPKVKGKLWIDKNDLTWARAEGEVIDTISIGPFLARLAKGSRIELEQTRVNDEVWLPKSVRVAASARIGLVKKMRADAEVSYKNYKKFSVDTQILPASEAP